MIFSLKHRLDEMSWGDLDKRPLPDWYKSINFGLLIHWGVYSVPAFHDFESTHRKSDFNGSEWYWKRSKAPSTSSFGYGPATKNYHIQNFGESFDYPGFADFFKAELWDPKEWSKQFKATGARVVILTAKHHDGF